MGNIWRQIEWRYNINKHIFDTAPLFVGVSSDRRLFIGAQLTTLPPPPPPTSARGPHARRPRDPSVAGSRPGRVPRSLSVVAADRHHLSPARRRRLCTFVDRGRSRTQLPVSWLMSACVNIRVELRSPVPFVASSPRCIGLPGKVCEARLLSKLQHKWIHLDLEIFP